MSIPSCFRYKMAVQISQSLSNLKMYCVERQRMRSIYQVCRDSGTLSSYRLVCVDIVDSAGSDLG